jgi:hypothetical protein
MANTLRAALKYPLRTIEQNDGLVGVGRWRALGCAAFSGSARELMCFCNFNCEVERWAGVKNDPGFSVSLCYLLRCAVFSPFRRERRSAMPA